MGTLQYALLSSIESILTQKTLGERLITASLNTVIGLIVVFFVLILITVMIYLFKFIPVHSKKQIMNPRGSSNAIDQVIAQISDQEEISLTDNSELVAVITAAIQAAMAEDNVVPSEGFIVRSIRRSTKRRINV